MEEEGQRGAMEGSNDVASMEGEGTEGREDKEGREDEVMEERQASVSELIGDSHLFLSN